MKRRGFAFFSRVSFNGSLRRKVAKRAFIVRIIGLPEKPIVLAVGADEFSGI